MMRDKEFNELSLDELNNVAGGFDWKDESKRQFSCIVIANKRSGCQKYAVVTGNIPLKRDDTIYIPAFHFIGEVAEVRPGASEYDNSITLFFPPEDGISYGTQTTQVYVLFEYHGAH